MKKPVFHIGFPKAGSTYLQRHVFPCFPDYNYKALHNCSNGKLKELYETLFKKDSLAFDKDRLKSIAKEVLAINSDKICLFSHESGTGTVYSYPDVIVKAERLYDVFEDNLKIIIIVREQRGILTSQYRDHPFEPHDIHRGKPVSFERWYRQTDKLRFFRFTELVHYNRLIEIYDRLFGRNNVLVLPMELMSSDPALYAQKLGKFLGIDGSEIEPHLKKPATNTGHSAGNNRLRKFRRLVPVPVEFSKILPAPLYNGLRSMINKGAKEKVYIPPPLEEEIRQRYGASNKMLENRVGIPLEPLGYAVKDDRAQDRELTIVESPYGTFTGYKNDRAIVQTKKFGAHTRPELSMVLSFVNKGDFVLDIGAHIGTFAVPIKNTIGPEGKLYAFEANPNTVELLKINLENNGLQAEVFNNGVSVKTGSLFIEERKNKYRSSGSDYLVESLSGNSSDGIEVELVQIDNAVSGNVDFIKIDVEGMEVHVLESAVKVIDRSRPVIYSEYVDFYIRRAGEDPQKFENFFKERRYHYFINGGERNAANDDFKLVRVPGPKYIRGQVDFLLIPEESERYPKEYANWYRHAPIKFLWYRFRNFLKDAKAGILGTH